MPTLKGTEASLSCVQCFLYLVSSSINVYFSYIVGGYFLGRPRIVSMCAKPSWFLARFL